MEKNQFCKIFQNFNIQFRLSIALAFVYFKNEAIIVDIFDNVYVLLNNTALKLSNLCGQGVKHFAFSQITIKDTFTYRLMALTSNGMVYFWGKSGLQVNNQGKNITIYYFLDF